MIDRQIFNDRGSHTDAVKRRLIAIGSKHDIQCNSNLWAPRLPSEKEKLFKDCLYFQVIPGPNSELDPDIIEWVGWYRHSTEVKVIQSLFEAFYGEWVQKEIARRKEVDDRRLDKKRKQEFERARKAHEKALIRFAADRIKREAEEKRWQKIVSRTGSKVTMSDELHAPHFKMCPACGGDGGISGRCYRCFGSGYFYE